MRNNATHIVTTVLIYITAILSYLIAHGNIKYKEYIEVITDTREVQRATHLNASSGLESEKSLVQQLIGLISSGVLYFRFNNHIQGNSLILLLNCGVKNNARVPVAYGRKNKYIFSSDNVTILKSYI